MKPVTKHARTVKPVTKSSKSRKLAVSNIDQIFNTASESFAQKDFDGAMSQAEKAIKLYKKIGNSNRHALAKMLLGQIYYAQGSVRSMKYFCKANHIWLNSVKIVPIEFQWNLLFIIKTSLTHSHDTRFQAIYREDIINALQSIKDTTIINNLSLRLRLKIITSSKIGNNIDDFINRILNWSPRPKLSHIKS